VRGFRHVRWLAVVSAVALTTGIAVPVLASTGQPGTAAGPGWRVTELLANGGDAATGAASSATDAWLATGAKILHWTGKDWQSVAAPEVIKKGAGTPFLALTPGQSSAWAFGYTQNPDTFVNRGFAVRWTGKGWASPTLFANGTVVQAAVAPARNDVWAFMLGSGNAVRYNGTKWTTAPSTGMALQSASALSANDIWVLGDKPGTVAGNFRLVVKHWNGKTWSAAKLPAVAVPGGEDAYADQITAISDRNIWVTGYLGFDGPDALLLHWNGAAWSQVTIPYELGDPIEMAADGTGGIWLSGLLDSLGQQAYLAHYAGGQWTSLPVPAVSGTTAAAPYGMAAIPGTRSVWGVGSVDYSTAPKVVAKGAILKYGS
jgi:hypothetical protein